MKLFHKFVFNYFEYEITFFELQKNVNIIFGKKFMAVHLKIIFK